MADDKPDDKTKAKAPALAMFRFSQLWSADIGVFLPGDEKELPRETAESLYLENMGEIL